MLALTSAVINQDAPLIVQLYPQGRRFIETFVKAFDLEKYFS